MWKWCHEMFITYESVNYYFSCQYGGFWFDWWKSGIVYIYLATYVILFIFLFSYCNFLIMCCSSELCHLSAINQSMVHRSHSGAYTPLKDKFACPLSCTFHISPSFSPGVWKCVLVALHPQWIRLWSTAWQLSGLKRNTRLDSITSAVQTVWMCLLLKGQPSLVAQYDVW